MAEARGELFLIADSDDAFVPRALERFWHPHGALIGDPRFSFLSGDPVRVQVAPLGTVPLKLLWATAAPLGLALALRDRVRESASGAKPRRRVRWPSRAPAGEPALTCPRPRAMAASTRGSP